MLPHLTNGWPPLGDGQRGLASLLFRLTPQDVNSYFVCILNTQRARHTRWGSIVGHRGVLEIFVCFVLFFPFFSECLYFFCVHYCSVFGTQCTGCHCLCVSASPWSPWTVVGGRAADQCTARIARRACALWINQDHIVL